MPFVSRRQLQTCFGKQLSAEASGKKWTWDCKEWLSHTQDPLCLPTLKGGRPKIKCRNLKPGEKIISPVYQGPRGGLYFYAGGVKVYVPKGEAVARLAKKKYGTA